MGSNVSPVMKQVVAQHSQKALRPFQREKSPFGSKQCLPAQLDVKRKQDHRQRTAHEQELPDAQLGAGELHDGVVGRDHAHAQNHQQGGADIVVLGRLIGCDGHETVG